MEQTLAELAEQLHGTLVGDGTIRIHGVNSIEAAQAGELTFAESPRRFTEAIASPASAIIVPPDVSDLDLGGRAGIRVANPKLAFALALDLFYPEASAAAGIHPTAVLGDNVHLEQPVSIGPHVVIGSHVSVGRGTVIESGVHIGEGATIGKNCLLDPNVVIYRRTHIGDRVKIHGGCVIGGDGFGYVFHQGQHVKVPQVGNVVIEDDVELGCNVCVDRATLGSTIIRRGTKVDNLVQIAHNDQIGRHVVMAGQVGLSGSVTIGDYSVLGGKAGVVDHVTVGDRAQIGAASVVTKSVASGEAMWGFPARPLRTTKQQLASLARLPAILKAMTGLLSTVRKNEDRLRRLEQRVPPP